jgi:hypothetical protein
VTFGVWAPKCLLKASFNQEHDGHVAHIWCCFGTMVIMTIYRRGLKRHLVQGERDLADGGYKRHICVLNRFLPGLNCKFKGEMARGRARHQTTNRRFTNWYALSEGFVML